MFPGLLQHLLGLCLVQDHGLDPVVKAGLVGLVSTQVCALDVALLAIVLWGGNVAILVSLDAIYRAVPDSPQVPFQRPILTVRNSGHNNNLSCGFCKKKTFSGNDLEKGHEAGFLNVVLDIGTTWA